MFIAVAIADKYLALFLNKLPSEELPSLTQLAAISLLIAAKLNEPTSPSFAFMIKLLKEK